MNTKPNTPARHTSLRRSAEARLRQRRKDQTAEAGHPPATDDTQRLLHELQVHQIELELQNSELQDARNRLEALLEKYTDLYDFAPVGYFSLDEQGRILEANLTGAALLGVERSRLIKRTLTRFVTPASLKIYLAFLERVFADPGKQVCEAAVLREGASVFWASFHGTSALSVGGPQKWCRVAVSDITSLKQAEEAQRRMETLAAANLELKQEIVRRQAVEEALEQNKQYQTRLLEQSRHMQEQLRHLSREILQTQEEERQRISRELHDEISQTLSGINVLLEGLSMEAAINPKGLKKQITRTQRLVEKSVDIVHRFARELRPTLLDDLGLVPALHAYMKAFAKRTGIGLRLRTFTYAKIQPLDSMKSTVLYRVAQEALTNVAKHAEASLVKVNLVKLPGGVALEIKDDGKSFQVDEVLSPRKYKRLGLIGMRERVEMVGGRFAVESAPGKGTTIRAEVPFENDTEE